jgi:hypothetical protein
MLVSVSAPGLPLLAHTTTVPGGVGRHGRVLWLPVVYEFT